MAGIGVRLRQLGLAVDAEAEILNLGGFGLVEEAAARNEEALDGDATFLRRGVGVSVSGGEPDPRGELGAVFGPLDLHLIGLEDPIGRGMAETKGDLLEVDGLGEADGDIDGVAAEESGPPFGIIASNAKTAIKKSLGKAANVRGRRTIGRLGIVAIDENGDGIDTVGEGVGEGRHELVVHKIGEIAITPKIDTIGLVGRD